MIEEATDLELVPARRLIEDPVDVVFGLAPGDRPLVSVDEALVVGAPIAERYRDSRLVEAPIPAGVELGPGSRWEPADDRPAGGVATARRRRTATGELLFSWKGRWRLATGELSDPLDAPFAGVVREVRPGSGVTVRAAGRGVRGIVTLGGPSHGRLELATGADGELRPGGLDVGLAGTILVVGSRVDAETLTRARAMGVRGIVVAGLSSKERRDFLASEARQRAALHRLPPYAVLVLDGSQRRSIAGPVMDLLEALAGSEVAIVGSPPMLVFDAPDVALPPVASDVVRVRGGSLAGREGRWAGGLGRRRFAGGVHLEAGRVRFSDGTTMAFPLGDLERFV
jgi:hypothetical protein